VVPEGLRGLILEKLPGVAEEIDRSNVVPGWLIDSLRREGAFDFESLGFRGVLEVVRLASKYSRGVAHVILVHNTSAYVVGGYDGLLALSITEPGGGSDLKSNLRTVAEGGDEARLRGVKAFTSNATYASGFLVLAVGESGPTLYLAERHESIKVRPLDLMGFRGSGVSMVEYSGTPALRVGEPGRGVRESLRAINFGRLGYAAIALGMADAALELIYRHLSGKKLFGAPALELQGVRWMVASIRYKSKLLEAAIEAAVSRAESEGEVDPELAAAAKVMAGELAREAGWAASQLMGGRGLESWSPASALYRDSKVIDIGEGAREVLLDFIASRALKSMGSGATRASSP
jgi:alkylation response protein AidB-like acyl-CoA dehydrogenase